ncbi:MULTISPECIES: GNAT family N-acetyltransferase [Actinomycetes]|uniref:N-acetyltransferase domain-containing protein n=2 Tax=Actinomycetes TaxID=1760 RepID=A0ABP6LZU1_9MICC
MTSELNDALVRTWVTGWARTHDYDVDHDGAVHSALRSGDSDDWEYVLHAPDETALRQVISAVTKSPGRLLTLIAEPGDESLKDSINGLERISDEEKLMVVDMGTQDVEDPITPEGYTTTREDFDGWTLFTVCSGDTVAARGRVAVVDEYAVLDRIYTNPDFRRQGLGTFVTRALVAIALESDVEEGLLVANAEGLELYEYLGWTLLGDVYVYGAPGSERIRPSHSQFDDLKSEA